MSEGDLKELQDEEVDLGVRRRVEYSDDEDGTLALVIPKREGGGEIEIPLLEHARTVFERTDGSMQDHTMLAVRPLAEVGRNRPVQRSGVTTNTGIATAMLRPGYLYVFFDNRLWRELEVGNDGKLSDVDVEHYRELAEGGDIPNERDSAGEWLDNILLPAMLQGQATLHRVRLARLELALHHLARSQSRPARFSYCRRGACPCRDSRYGRLALHADRFSRRAHGRTASIARA